MKTMKKAFALMLALAMVLSFSLVAHAADPTGSITISNAVIDREYSVYKIFDLSYDGADAYSYTFNSTGADDLLAALLGSASPFTLEQIGSSSVYNVTLKNSKTAADVSSFLKTQDAAGYLGTAARTETAATSTVAFASLPYGYYFIKAGTETSVTIDTVNTDITVIDKNTKPSWENPGDPDKEGKVILQDDGAGNITEVKVNSINVTDTVSFKIGVDAANYKDGNAITYFYITDTLGSGLNYVPFSASDSDPKLTVKVTDNDHSTTATLIKGTDWDFVTSTGNPSDTSFEIWVKWAIKNADVFNPIYVDNSTIEVFYDATVTSNYVIAGTGNPNTANFKYKTEANGDPEDPDVPPTTPPSEDGDGDGYPDSNKEETTTYIFALGISKVDSKTKDPLAGAKFSAEDSDGNAIYAKKIIDGVYEFCADTDTGAVTEFEVAPATATNKGQLVIKGVKAGDYTFTETEAPAGYNKLAGTFSVSAAVSEVNTYTAEVTTYYDAAGNVVSSDASTTSKTVTFPVNVTAQVVENNTGTELPSTGGIGTTIFYILGSLMVVSAGVLLITKKRMAA